ncbi:MAG: hypothetical protein KJS92_07305 [Bacteroidetes bacterium]|nr:hypothetical protein [Bacteroidota bacterium]
MRYIISILAILSLNACCVDPPPTKIIYTGINILADEIKTPRGSYVSFTVPVGVNRREEEGKKKAAICHTKVLGFSFENPFDTGKFVLQLNKPLSASGVNIPAYTNLLKLPVKGLGITNAYYNMSGNYPERLIVYADSAQVQWPSEVMLIFRGTTVKQETFADSVVVRLN